jgi:hypothetical protein
MPSQPTDSGAGTRMHLASIEAVAELTIRLGRVMRPEYVITWRRQAPMKPIVVTAILAVVAFALHHGM